MKINLKSNFKWIIAIGVILRLILSITTFHPDLRAYILASKFIVHHGGIFTFYDYVSKLAQDSQIKQIYGDGVFIYTPLAYLIPALFYLPFSSFLLPITQKIVIASSQFIASKAVILPLFIYKAPFLFFDFLILYFLPRLFENKKHGRLAQLLWLFNPISWLVLSMGQSDAIIAFFLLLALISIKKKNLIRAAIFISLSSLVKPIGLIILPLIILYSFINSRKETLKVFLAGVLPFFIGILPYLRSPAFKTYALLAQHTGKATFAGISIASGHVIPWFFIFVAIIAIALINKKISLIEAVGLSLFSSLAFNHFHPQWFLWLIPYLIYTCIKEKQLSFYFLLLFSWLVILFSFDSSLHVGLFIYFKDIKTQFLSNHHLYKQVTMMARAFIIAFVISRVFRPKYKIKN